MVEQAQIEVFVLGADVDAVAQRLRTALSGLRRAPGGAARAHRHARRRAAQL